MTTLRRSDGRHSSTLFLVTPLLIFKWLVFHYGQMAESRHLLLTCRKYSSSHESLLSQLHQWIKKWFGYGRSKITRMLWSHSKNLDMYPPRFPKKNNHNWNETPEQEWFVKSPHWQDTLWERAIRCANHTFVPETEQLPATLCENWWPQATVWQENPWSQDTDKH